MNDAGRAQVAEAAARNAGQFDEIYAGTKDRHLETAGMFAQFNPQAGEVKPNRAFDPMHLGVHEGEEVTPERLADINDRLRNRPDEPIPGVGKFPGRLARRRATGRIA
jgi:broad specificity phosphatase PhoE